MKYLVYKHTRKDNNKVFYIGCSKNNLRPFDFKARSKEWFDVFNSTEISVDIIKQELKKEDALELELFLIENYNGLVNKVGNGYTPWNFGLKLSNEHKEKLKKNSGRAKKVKCTLTGKVYKTVTEASNYTKYSRGHVKNMLNGLRTNKTSLVWG